MDATVIIATRNRAALLKATLTSLVRQETSGLLWELIVVDNGSSDETAHVLSTFAQQLPLTVIYFAAEGQNRARNRALAIARGNLLLFTDDDVTLCPKWIASIHEAAGKFPDASVFCGPIVPDLPEGLPWWIARHWFAGVAYAQFSVDQSEGPLAENRSPCGGNLAIRRAALAQNRFDEALGPQGTDFPMCGELELLARLKKQGHTTIYVPQAEIRHHVGEHQARLPWLFARAFRFGRGRVRLDGDCDSRRLFGVPWYLYVLVSLLWVRRQIGKYQAEFWRFETGVMLEIVRGRISEYRRLARQPKKPTEGERSARHISGISRFKKMWFDLYTPVLAGRSYVQSVTTSDDDSRA